MHLPYFIPLRFFMNTTFTYTITHPSHYLTAKFQQNDSSSTFLALFIHFTNQPVSGETVSHPDLSHHQHTP